MARRRSCGVCPMWRNGWCAHLAKRMQADASACDFGLHEMRKSYVRAWFAKRRQAKGKGRKCAEKISMERMYRDLSAAHGCTMLASNDKIMAAETKPIGVSAVRWRMELRRRAMPTRYAYAANPIG